MQIRTRLQIRLKLLFIFIRSTWLALNNCISTNFVNYIITTAVAIFRAYERGANGVSRVEYSLIKIINAHFSLGAQQSIRRDVAQQIEIQS